MVVPNRTRSYEEFTLDEWREQTKTWPALLKQLACAALSLSEEERKQRGAQVVADFVQLLPGHLGDLYMGLWLFHYSDEALLRIFRSFGGVNGLCDAIDEQRGISDRHPLLRPRASDGDSVFSSLVSQQSPTQE